MNSRQIYLHTSHDKLIKRFVDKTFFNFALIRDSIKCFDQKINSYTYVLYILK